MPAALIVFAACDNVGRAFDPIRGGGNPTDGTGIVVVPEGGDLIEGRPKAKEAFPTGGGWPTTVPIVVVFNESMDEDSIIGDGGGGGQGGAGGGSGPTVYVRVEGTEQALPASYDFLLGSRVVIVRPAAPLQGGASVSFEVVVAPDARDVDGVRFGGKEPDVVATFTADQDASFENGEILVTLPADNERMARREDPVYAVFNKPVNPQSVTTANFRVQTAAGVAVPGSVSFPLRAGPVDDPRILSFEPDTALAGDTDHQIVVDDTITFGTTGKLDFRNRTPFARFTTVAPAEPIDITVGNASPGFPDKINLGNLPNLQIDASLGASARAGDRILVRIYGLDPQTAIDDDINFVQRAADVPVDGVQTVNVDFSSALGAPGTPRFSDGGVTIAAQAQRGGQRTGFVHSDPARSPRLDVTPPTLAAVGPPVGALPGDIVTDQESLVMYGTASEKVGQGSLTVGSSTTDLFASSGDGRFLFKPVALGRITAAMPYTMSLTDDAGNMAATSLSGNVLQRGTVTGAFAGDLTVEAYDEATFAGVPDVLVVVDPGLPQKPAAAGRRTAMTGPDGRAAFSGLAAGSHSVTVIKAGYHLTSLLDTQAAHVSLPVRPMMGATASLGGTAAFVPTPGQSALVGCNALDDVRQEEIVTSPSSPTQIAATAIRPNRPLVITAFSGTFEPVALNAYVGAACAMCGPDLMTLTPPVAPVAPGDTGDVTLALLPAAATTVNLSTTFTKDFAMSTGLGAISGKPTVRVVGSLSGLGGMALFGVGFAVGSGPSYTINGSYSVTSYLTLIAFAPRLWVSTEAADGAGNVARHRRLISNPSIGVTFPTVPTPGIPAITPPTGPFTGSPAVDYIDRMDASTLPFGFAITELVATDPAGRSWRVLWQDADGAGANDTVQLPDLQGLVGPAAGTWSCRVEEFLFVSQTFAAGDYLLEERFREAVTWARAAAVDFTVQ